MTSATDARPQGARAAIIAVAVWAGVAAAAGIPAPAWPRAQTIADEPQYLLTALSLAADGNLDIADELADERWRAFHATGLPEQTRLLEDGRRVSPHDPLLPLLLAPGMAVGGWVGAKATLALVAAAVAALTCWLAIARLRVRPGIAAATTAIFAGSLPLAPYGSHVYPELPAALAVLAGVAALTAPVLHRRALWLLGAAVVALPWLAVKHAGVAAALAGVGVWRLLREGRRDAVLGLGVGLAAAGAVYLAVHQLVWTGWTVYASGDHFVERGELSAVGFHPDYWGRTRRLVGLLVDARYGIAAWQPAWLLAIPAVAAFAAAPRAGPPAPGSADTTVTKAALLLPLAAGWATATWVALTMQGFWVPGRQVVVVLPLAVLAIAWWAERVPRVQPVLWVLGALGVAAHLWLAVEAATGGVTWVDDFWTTTFPPYALWRLALPDYVAPSTAMWLLHGAWCAAALAAGAMVVWSRRPRAA